MRPLFLSLGAGILAMGTASAQVAGDASAGTPQLPVGQVFKQFAYPYYQEGVLQYTLSAVEARGITLNRAETTDLKIELYANGVKTTTITSPTADLYVNERKMRTKYTVLIERDDMEASSQECDFDVKLKKYLLRTHVKVTLKHFDISASTKPAAGAPPHPAANTGATPAPVPAPASEPLPSSTPAPIPEPVLSATPAPQAESGSTPGALSMAPTTPPVSGHDALLPSPSSYSDTNSAPLPPSPPDSK
jgi:hypothetical protein